MVIGATFLSSINQDYGVNTSTHSLHDWDTKTEQFKKEELFTVDQFNPKRDANYIQIKSATLNSKIDGIPSGSVYFSDPWSSGTTGASATFSAENNSQIKKVFLNETKDVLAPNKPYYQVASETAQPGYSGNNIFLNWSVTGADPLTNSGTAQPIVFRSNNASVTANYKAHLRTAQPNNAYSKNQRRFAVNGTNQILVYESMNDVWFTTSTNSGTTWSAEKRLNVRQGFAKNPTLSNVLADGKVVIGWVEINASNVAELHLQTYNIANTNPFGWSVASATQSSANHKIASDFGFSAPSSNSTPSLYLESATVFGIAFNDVSNIKAGRLSITSDLSTAALLGSVKSIGSGSLNPNYVYTANDGKIYVYYTAPGSTNGVNAFQYDWNANTTTELYLPSVYTSTGQYSAIGLQAAINNGTVVLAYQVSSAGGNDVLYYTKPAYYSSPQFYTRYVKGNFATVTNTSTNPYSVSG